MTGWWEFLARLRRVCRGAAPEPVTFSLLAQRESHQRERAPRFAAATSSPRAVSLRCSTSPAVCATRAPTRLLQVPQARVVNYPFIVYPLAQCSPETPDWSALLGGEQGPRSRVVEW